MNDRDRARSALQAIDAGCERETWVRVGMAAKAAGLDFEDFDSWSSTAGNYAGERDTRAVWKSFSDGAIKAGTLFAVARESGWRDESAPRLNGHRRNVRMRESHVAPEKKVKDATFDFAAVWRDAEPATANHPYIARKLGLFEGLRVYRGPLVVAKQALDGALLVPVYGADGALQTWQAVPAGDGKKVNAPGGAVAGWFAVGGAPRAGEPCYIVEGIGQAWSAHQATTKPAVVAFGAGRIETVARAIAERTPDARLVLVADVGKEAETERIARALACAWVAAPADLGKNGDVNDLHQRNGMQAVADLLAGARTPERRFRFLTVGELLRKPAPVWRVVRVIPARGLIVIWGASGSGKTFLALDMAASVARGVAWADRRTRRGTVAYIAAEGQLRERADAYLRHHELDDADLSGLRILDSAVNLLDPRADVEPLIDDLGALGRETGGVALVVIDTLNRVMPGGDENSSEDMGLVVAAAQRIERELECAVAFIHHSGKDESKGSRGHSSLKAATDAEISVKRDADIRTVTAEKVRDGADGEVLLTFRLAVVDLGSAVDPDADPAERRTSCVVAPQTTPTVAASAGRLSDTDEIALRALRSRCAETDDHTEATSLHPAGLPRITIDEWREAFRRARGIDRTDPRELDASRKAFQRAVDKLVQRRIVGAYESRVWLW